jgi:hypothetical protein
MVESEGENSPTEWRPGSVFRERIAASLDAVADYGSNPDA